MNEESREARGVEGHFDEGHFNEQERADERGDAAEPDAPTQTEENAGMSTILSGGQGVGVQNNLGEE